VAGGAEGGMGGVEQGVTPDEKQPDTAQTAVPGEPAPPPEPAAEKQAQRRWRKWVTTRRLTALVGVLGLAFGIWNAVFKDVREKKLAREAVVAELEALADDIRAFVVPRRASRSSVPRPSTRRRTSCSKGSSGAASWACVTLFNGSIGRATGD
jgi:hypothetical protein